MTIYEALKEEIKILNREFRNEDEIIEILKRRLTKKEYKYFMMKVEGTGYDILRNELRVEGERLMEIAVAVNKKLNSEKIKHEITVRV